MASSQQLRRAPEPPAAPDGRPLHRRTPLPEVGQAASASDPATITAFRDGPLLVRGPFRIEDQDGNEIVIERRTVALCRCGKSRVRPLCDGTHKLIRFRAPSGLENGRASAGG